MKNNIFIRIFSLILVLIIASLSIFSCNKTKDEDVKVQKKEKIYYQYFDTVCSIYDYTGESEDQFRQVYLHFEDRLNYYHKLFDIYHEYDGVNNVATINANAGVKAVKVDDELIKFLEFAVEMHTLTDGNVNIAMGSVLSIWHKYRTLGVAVPTAEELSEAAKHTDITKMIIDKENSTVYLSDPHMSLDVGAIAKGYTAEIIAHNLEERGITSYVLDLGGNLRVIGTQKNGSPWRTGVQNPDFTSDNAYVYYINISNTSAVTSGDYQRRYYVDGKSYHHIINKDTLMPADYFSSVTIITPNSGMADALSTALFNMDYESGKKIASSLGNVSVVWVDTDGTIKTYGLDGENVNYN